MRRAGNPVSCTLLSRSPDSRLNIPAIQGRVQDTC